MKKALSILLSAAMIFSIYLPTFAEETEPENKTTITATVANHDPSYTLHVPAATTITQDVTTAQELDGKVYVTDISYMEGKKVTCTPTGTDLKKSDSNDTITTAYLYKTATGMDAPSAITKFDCGVGESNGASIYAQVEKAAWDAAPNGNYSATITFEFAVDEKITLGSILENTSIPTASSLTDTTALSKAWLNKDDDLCFILNGGEGGLKLVLKDGNTVEYFGLDISLTRKSESSFICSNENSKQIELSMQDNKLFSITYSNGSDDLNGVYKAQNLNMGSD